MNSIEFLEWVYTTQEQDGYIVLSTKAGTWTDTPYPADDLPDELPNDGVDVYFTPSVFTNDRRLRTTSQGGQLLYADLDEIDPRDLTYLPPSIAWETSPGRYQAIWVLESPLGPKALERLNKAVTYRTGADKGGWGLNKVLRVPGSTSTKHGAPWEVRILWFEPGRTYTSAEVRKEVKEALPASDTASGKILMPKSTAAQIRAKHRPNMSASCRKLLRQKVIHTGDDRSKTLWKLEGMLLEAGLTPGEVVKVVQDTPFNKYKGQRRELRMLWGEVNRQAGTSRVDVSSPVTSTGASAARNGRLEGLDDPDRRYVPIRMSKYLALNSKPPSWLVDQVWSNSAHGLWAGDFKTYKSTMLIDLALSVATGMPFLGKFEIHHPGPVLMIQEENAPSFMNDKLQRIASSKGQATAVNWSEGKIESVHLGEDPPLTLLNQKKFNLTDDDDLRWLDNFLRFNPHRLIILDPLYRMMPGKDEKLSEDMIPILSSLATIATERQTALILAHHFKKPTGDKSRQGDQVSGSSALNRWWASAVYVNRAGEANENKVRFSFEHREHPNLGVKHATVSMVEDDDQHYEVFVEDVEGDSITLPPGLDDLDMVQGQMLDFDVVALDLGMAHKTLRTKIRKHPDFKFIYNRPNGVPQVVKL